MSVTSVVQIYNLALMACGQELLAAEDETGRAASYCRLLYPISRDATLRAHPWNFAVRRASLAALAITPTFEFDYAYALPTDPYCLKVIRTDWEASGWTSAAVYGFPGVHNMMPAMVDYRIETIRYNDADVRALLCNEATMKIEYIARITDVAQYDSLFVSALAERLASELAVPLADNQALAKTRFDLYQAKLVEARTVDAQEGTAREIVNTDTFLVARQ